MRGQGHVERAGRGWRAVLWVAGKRVRSEVLPTREAADQARLLVLEELGRQPELAAAPTLRSWGRQWLQRRGGRSQGPDRSRWRRHLETAPFATTPLRDLDRQTIKRWVGQLGRRKALLQQEGGDRAPGEQPVSAQTIRHIVNLLRRCLADAVDDGLIKDNPAAGLRLEVAEHQRREWTHLSAEEIAALLASPLTPLQRAVFAVAIYAGLREGELIALQWEDVHLGERPHLVVRRSHGGPTKSERKRVVPLLEQAHQALLAWRGQAPAQTGLVWPAPRGGRRARSDDFGWATKRRGKQAPTPGAREIAGLRPEVTFHDLRHTFASHLVMGTWGRAWRLDEVRDLLGHSDVAVTQRYAHLSPEYLHAAAAATRRPTTGPRPGEQSESSSSVGIAGFEPAAFGFGGQRASLDNQGLARDLGRSVGRLFVEAAWTVLETAAAGKDLPAQTVALLGVDPSDPQAARKAVDAAARLLLAASNEGEKSAIGKHSLEHF